MTLIKVFDGDIAQLRVDAIVNAANKTLKGGGGLDGMIHHLAGPELLEECKTLGGCPTGEARITKGYNLPAKHVIHTVGPIYGYEKGGTDEQLLANCYVNSLKLAKQYGLRSVAFPGISTGVFHYPKDEAAKIAIDTVKGFIAENPDAFDEILFVMPNELNYKIYQEYLR